jgi:uncharacterized protein YgfB (UPF0149 family)
MIMSDYETAMPDFDEIADLFWRLGVMQSPSQLHGFLSGQIAVANEPTMDVWLAQAQTYMEGVEPTNSDENRLLMQLYSSSCQQFSSGNLEYELLLPDDAVEISQRVECLSQWCSGFLAGFAMAGKDVQARGVSRQYSENVAEALSDMGSISQVELSDDDVNEEQRERDYFEISEYLRLAAITIYLECKQQDETDKGEPSATRSSDDKKDFKARSPADLFSSKNNKLH